MIYLRGNSKVVIVVFLLISFGSCRQKLSEIKPKLITEQTPHDTDDPAIWINTLKPEQSIIFGTDKDEINGGVYAFNLDGKIVMEKSIVGLSYPNNVDIGYNVKINDSLKTDILAFTEREKHQIRIYSVPDMKPLDNGGLKVFKDEPNMAYRRPMGIALYSDRLSDKTYVIVSRKEGPKNGYLHQYLLSADSLGIELTSVRKFGNFSGKKEIEAIAVDEELGFIYYADEDNCIRKYYADPDKGDEELSCFGAEHFQRDIEGIAIAKKDETKGYLIVSNQQANSFSVFDRITNIYKTELYLGTSETDGCEVTTTSLGHQFPDGLFVAMSDTKEFYYFDYKSLNLD